MHRDTHTSTGGRKGRENFPDTHIDTQTDTHTQTFECQFLWKERIQRVEKRRKKIIVHSVCTQIHTQSTANILYPLQRCSQNWPKGKGGFEGAEALRITARPSFC